MDYSASLVGQREEMARLVDETVHCLTFGAVAESIPLAEWEQWRERMRDVLSLDRVVA